MKCWMSLRYSALNSSREAFETIDLLELSLLLGQSLADNLAGLGVSLVADTLSVLVGIVDDGLSGLLGSDQGSGNLALLSGEVRGGAATGAAGTAWAVAS